MVLGMYWRSRFLVQMAAAKWLSQWSIHTVSCINSFYVNCVPAVPLTHTTKININYNIKRKNKDCPQRI